MQKLKTNLLRILIMAGIMLAACPVAFTPINAYAAEETVAVADTDANTAEPDDNTKLMLILLMGGALVIIIAVVVSVVSSTVSSVASAVDDEEDE